MLKLLNIQNTYYTAYIIIYGLKGMYKMLIHPKIDKLCFVIKKGNIIRSNLDDIIAYLERREDVQFNNSPRYITVNMNPTKLSRPNLNYNDSMKHNLQMNLDLIINFFEELQGLYVSSHLLNITNLHIAKDRIMEEIPQIYYDPLISNQTQYKGRVEAFKVTNGTTPSVHICNKSTSMKRGIWLDKFYNKGAQLQDHLGVDEIMPLEPLSKEDIKILGRGYSKYTGRINLTKINLMRQEFELKGDGLLLLPHTGKRLRVVDIMTMIKGNTLYDNLNRVFKTMMEKAVFPEKKKPTKMSPLDEFIVSGSMSRFDRLFQALGKYQAYKEYTNSVVTDDDKLLNEIYDKFI